VLTAPSSSDTIGCLQHLHSLQLPNDPILFGLHPNAAAACNKEEGRRLLEDVAAMQRCSAAAAAGPAVTATPAAETAAGATAGTPAAAAAALVVLPLEVQMSGVIKQLLAQLPQQLDRAEASILHNPFAVLPCGRVSPMGVVLQQEIDRCGCVSFFHLVEQSWGSSQNYDTS
jgi:hypothetical protein